MLHTIPQHRVGAVPIFVSSADQAWNHARIDEERAAMKAAGEDPNTHPVWLYWIGATRYDLHARLRWKDGAAAVTDWLDLPNATLFTLRRLSPRHFSKVHPRIQNAHETGVPDREIELDACRWGLESVVGPSAPELRGGIELTEGDIEVLRSTWGMPMVWELGRAAYTCSVPLREDEKKVFAS